MKKFIFGHDVSIRNSMFLDSNKLWHAVGQNTGNLAFHYGIQNLFKNSMQSISWGSSIENINAAGELAIMPCANQLGAHVDLGTFSQKLSEMTPRILSIGLGAQGSVNLDAIPDIPQGTLDWVRQIILHAKANDIPNITVRGDFTKKVMDHYGFGDNCVSLGCPSLFINPSVELGLRLEKRYKEQNFKKIGIAAGHPAWKPLVNIERSLVKIMEEYQGEYIVQADPNMIAMSRGDFGNIDKAFFSMFKEYVNPSFTDEQMLNWIKRYMVTFFDIPAWLEYLKRFDFVIGSRIHGVMLALQAGVPGVCIAHDSRIRELCEKSNIPWIAAHEVRDGFNINNILDRVNFDGAAYDSNRAKLFLQQKEFMSSNF